MIYHQAKQPFVIELPICETNYSKEYFLITIVQQQNYAINLDADTGGYSATQYQLSQNMIVDNM